MKQSEKILLSHGSGGKLTHDLIREVFLKNFRNPILSPLQDSAVIKIGKKRFAFTTDSFVVDPIFFPGGDIGSLAVHGTVNDIAVMGAKPLYLSCGIIMEEGFDKSALKKIIASMKLAANKAKVEIVTGDTKVVERGAADKIFVNTSGIGIFEREINLSTKNIRLGDIIIVSGTIGDHGAAILSRRKGLEFKTKIKSDSASLYELIKNVLKTSAKIRFMRDPTRGGIATTLNETAQEIPYGIEIYEKELPFRNKTSGLSEILGLDPLYLPNEGMVLIVVSQKDASKVIEILKKQKLGKNAKIIGKIIREHKNLVILKTIIGGSRLIEMLTAEQLPRIC